MCEITGGREHAEGAADWLCFRPLCALVPSSRDLPPRAAVRFMGVDNIKSLLRMVPGTPYGRDRLNVASETRLGRVRGPHEHVVPAMMLSCGLPSGGATKP